MPSRNCRAIERPALRARIYPRKRGRPVSRAGWQPACNTARGRRAVQFKVRNGTPVGGGGSLCQTCRHSTIIRGQAMDEEIVQCQAAPMTTTRIRFKVTSCSSYNDERLPSYLQLMEQAWILQPGSRRREAGFIRARELREEEIRSVMEELRTATDD